MAKSKNQLGYKKLVGVVLYDCLTECSDDPADLNYDIKAFERMMQGYAYSTEWMGETGSDVAEVFTLYARLHRLMRIMVDAADQRLDVYLRLKDLPDVEDLRESLDEFKKQNP